MGKMKTYKSPHYAQAGGVLYKPGQPFTTDAEPAKDWEEIDAAEKASTTAAGQLGPGDPALETLGVEALKALAATKNVDLRGLTKKEDIITAIKAANEPAL